jgi:hypothetical protein
VTDSQPAIMHLFDIPVPIWTGRLNVDLTDPQGQLIGTVEIVVRIDNVTLWYGNRTLAVMDRDSFRDWLIHPGRPFAIDDVVWTSEGATTLLSIDQTPACTISGAIIDYLVAMV